MAAGKGAGPRDRGKGTLAMTDKPVIEVVVERLDTVEDQIKVFADGEPVDATVVMVDIGRGWQRPDWNSYRVTVEGLDLSAACKVHVGQVFERHNDSEYIVEE